MPIYEYVCNECSHEFEQLQRFSDPPESVCPSCKGQVSRKLSTSAFHLHGGGWSSDGYRSGGNGTKKPASAPEEGAAKPDKGACAACGGDAAACA